MSFVGFRTFVGDAAQYAEMASAGRNKMLELGASSVRTSVVLSGPTVGSAQIATMFDTADEYYEASAAALGDPSVQAAMAAAGATQTNAGLLRLEAETGDCSGTYMVASQVRNSVQPTAADWAEVQSVVEDSMLAQGANGYRGVSMVSAGEMTGAFGNLFYTDSVDAVVNASANPSPAMSALMQRLGVTIVNRVVTRTID
tara:strand:+ start:210 stop:809 length:600 start_codon:yes stop_codon:yes gene_type:complete